VLLFIGDILNANQRNCSTMLAISRYLEPII
jgi:hypothetical protein